jgi:hypothetical protein
LIESVDLGEKRARLIERDMAPENSWRLEMDGPGDLRWVTKEQVLTDQPALNFRQRFQDWIFLLFPKSLY